MFLTYNIATQADNFPEINFDVLSVSLISYDANWHSTPHYHEFLEIFYCLEGEGSLVTKHGEQIIKTNSLILVNPYIEHTERTTIENPLKYMVIGVHGPELVLPDYFSDTGLFYFQDDEELFKPLIQSILTECDQEKFYSKYITTQLVNALLLRISEYANSPYSDTPTKTYSVSVVLAKQYIDNHYSQVISLDTLEERTHISRFHLSHLFKEEINMSPIQYLSQVRFEQAKKLLTTTNMSVFRIAESVGFSSDTYFSKRFKEYVGLTPNRYRTKYRNINPNVNV